MPKVFLRSKSKLFELINKTTLYTYYHILKTYLKGYYGYKNFGDEILFFGVVNFIINHFKIKKLVVEVEDESWMYKRNQINNKLNILTQDIQNKIDFVPIQQHRFKRQTHLSNILGISKYSNYYTIFGGGEIICDERKFPHDGRNYIFLKRKNILKKNYSLIGGISKPTKLATKLLYKILINRADQIILRDKFSYDLALQYNKIPDQTAFLYQDFSIPVMQHIDQQYLQDLEKQKTILINISSMSYDSHSLSKIKTFCSRYPDCQKIFFPCDMQDDINYYKILSQQIDGLQLYDRTQNSLDQTFKLFKTAQAGIGSRLHFLFPLKYFNTKFEAIIHTHKVQKLIDS